MILPIITCASPCLHLSKQSQAKIEIFQKRVLLPLSLFLQILDLLHLSKLCQNDRQTPKPFEKTFNPRSLAFKFELPKVGTEKASTEFCFKTCRAANFLPPDVEFFNPIDLKKQMTAF